MAMENMKTDTVQVRVRDLVVQYPGGTEAVTEVNMDILAGETLGIVGESGCGKSTLGSALVGDVPRKGKAVQGSVVLKASSREDAQAIDLAKASERELRDVWGRRVSMVYQDPVAALNPSLTIGDQVEEAVARCRGPHASTAWERTVELLRVVHLPAPARIARRYPHQLSGGQQQRAVIAMALAASPDLLVMDEPTTGLDVTTEARILDLVQELQDREHASIVFITHNLAVVAQVADRVAVMYAGELVEIGPVRDIFARPSMPYTLGLLSCIPRVDRRYRRGSELRTIPGGVPSPDEEVKGCAFAARCPFAQDRCWQEHPGLSKVADNGHYARCHYASAVAGASWPVGVAVVEHKGLVGKSQGGRVLTGSHISKAYGQTVRRFVVAGPIVRRPLRAVDDVTLDLGVGQTLAIVGESGCGKSTLLSCIAGLTPVTSGQVSLGGETLAARVRRRPQHVLRRIQMVFQNPDRSLNPQHRVGQILGRAVNVLDQEAVGNVRKRVESLLERVGLDRRYLERKPAQLSGGEKQRVAIARALAGRPDVVLADEVTSSLDVSVRAAILNLLKELQVLEGVSFIFVSHDMSAVRYMADDVIVLYLGMVVESGPADQVFDPPYHPYTEALMSAIPVPDPDVACDGIELEGSVPSASRRPGGCPFHTRCPRSLGEICEREVPPVQEVGSGHLVRCHIKVAHLQEMQMQTRGAA